VNYKFACSVCSSNHRERFQLTSCSWIESVIGGMAHLTWTTQRTRFKVKEIGNHLEEHWDTLCYQREKRSNWRGCALLLCCPAHRSCMLAPPHAHRSLCG
jgi:hypothetical protein